MNRSVAAPNEMNQNFRVTQADIARKVGCSQVTVSRALNGDRRVAADLKATIQQVADKLGYRPDPMLRALVTSRRYLNAKSVNASIAFVYVGRKPDPATPFSNFEYYKGVKDKSEALGFNLEVLKFDSGEMSPERLASILRHRGVKGVIFALSSGHWIFAQPLFDLPDFAYVSLGYNFAHTPVNCIMPDNYHSITVALRAATQRGFKRVGLSVSKTQNERIDYAFTDSFRRMAADNGIDPDEMIHLFRHETDEERAHIDDRLAEWMERARPQVVIGELGTRPHLEDVLRKEGKQLGKDLPFICLDIRARINGDDSGLIGNRELMGQRAVENIASQITRNHAGLPRTYERLLVQSTWHDGNTF